MPRASVLLADDNSAILEHVTKLLQRDNQFDVVAALADGSAVMAAYTRLKPEVIVLDISMGEVNGIDVARNLRDAGCQSKIVFLTVHEDSDFVNAAMGVGGSAYVVKSRLGTDLISAISAVLCDKLFVSSSLMYRAH